ncbi:restriction endonuclease subunit S [Succinivibrio dextrinosolvens]|uniref:restriction endonuclease subunit S n=1 Tax=Succinivibrio dextrinosolvens TaxID=83771 RepID=UPI0013E93EEF|nr:restriction endonuclease subunit S [Succinivibrio dextrinosolvens]
MSETWEQRKLEESFDFLQNNTLSRAELGDSGAAVNVHYGDILVKFGDCIYVSKNELPHITNQNSVEKLKNSYLKDGDVVMADTAEDKIVLSGLHTIPLRPKNKFGKGLLGHLGFWLSRIVFKAFS